jgi:hypothetical protein
MSLFSENGCSRRRRGDPASRTGRCSGGGTMDFTTMYDEQAFLALREYGIVLALLRLIPKSYEIFSK